MIEKEKMTFLKHKSLMNDAKIANSIALKSYTTIGKTNSYLHQFLYNCTPDTPIKQ